MVVCHCHVVTDRDVHDAHAAGARTLGEVKRACGAARSCGGCRPALRELLARLANESRLVHR